MENNEFYKNILLNMYEGIYFVDEKRRITFWNNSAERITGFSAAEVVGKSCFANILNHIDACGKHLCSDGCPLQNTIHDGQMREASVFLQHKAGNRIPVTVRSIPIRNNEKIVGAVEIFIDDSEKNEVLRNMEEYKNQAMKDPLTGLPNRRYIDSFLSSKYKEFQELGIEFGVLFMDIDHFKHCNDDYGHDVGDEVLKMLAKTFLASTRAIDLIGRFGGEEFIAILTGLDQEALVKRAESMRIQVANSSLDIGPKKISVTISIGAALINPEDTLDTIIKRADEQLYQSKEQGRNRVTFG